MDVPSDLFLNLKFNSFAEVLTLWAMENNVSLGANCLTVDAIWFDGLWM